MVRGFLLDDSGPGDPSRMIIFATGEALEILSSSDHWFGDGTFEVSPFIFSSYIQYMLYTTDGVYPVRLHCCQIKDRLRMIDFLVK